MAAPRSTTSPSSRLQAFAVQLRKRKVLQTVPVYIVGALALWGAVDFAARAFAWPGSVLRHAVYATIAGFPLAMIAAWFLDVRVERRAEAPGSTSKVVAGALGFGAAGGVLVFVVLLSAFGPLGLDDSEELLRRGLRERTAVAVLPFVDLSPAGDMSQFADGVAEEVLTDLQSWGAFPVVSRGSSFTYRGPSIDLAKMREELGVLHVLEGSVLAEGDAVRVTARLIDADSGTQTWSGSFETAQSGVFDAIDALADEIVTSVAPEVARLETRRATRAHPEDLEAWQLALRARELIRKGDLESMGKARQLAEQALERDPGSALSMTCLAEILHDLQNTLSEEFELDEANAALNESLEYARRARRIAPALVDARIWYGHLLLHHRHLEDGVAELREAVRLCPSHAQARGELGFGLACVGLYEEALAEVSLALRLSPNDPDNERIRSLEPVVYLFAGLHERAATAASRVVLANPLSPQTKVPALVEICALMRLERTADATDRVAKFRADRPPLDWSGMLRTPFPPAELTRMHSDLTAAGLITKD